MASHSILVQNKGFTLLEILIALTILSIIFSLGLFISFDFYKSYAFHSEKNTIVSILQRARSESLDNVDQTRHGVHFQNNPPQYTIFECKSTTPQCTDYIDADLSKNILINQSYDISITNPSPLPFDAVFDQLSGSCVTANCSLNPLTITVSDGTKSYDISINNVGRINW